MVISDIEGGFFLVRESTPAVCNATVPTSVSSSNVQATSATVSWNSVANATYDVRYRAVGSSSWITNGSSSTSANLSGLTPSTQYEAQVRSKCSDGSTSQYSGSITFTTTTIQITYCSSNGNDVSDEYISNVSLGSINNNSGASSGGYIDYTSISTDLPIDDTHTITITPTWTGTTYSEGYSVWIDFNRDGDFTDSGEQVWTQSATQTTPVSGSFTIPTSTTEGSTRMRVSMKYNAIPTSCESFRYGEVEDYTVNIIGGGGNPNPGGCTTGISSFPYNEGFENTLGDWIQSTTDDIDWSTDANGTPSRNTGPSSATQGTYYLYVEASGNGTGYPNKQAIINSPCFDLSGKTSATFSFSYHMFGASSMGSIALEASTDEGTSWTSLWSQTGNQGNSWNPISINLSAYLGGGVQLRFNRITGSTWQADIAIDDIGLTTSGTSRVSSIDNKLNDIIIYPNPIQGPILNVTMKNKENSTYEITSITGQLVGKGNVINTIDVSNLRSGIYFIQIATDQQIYSRRFVKK
ncbi:T9SS type A sorting domain-containing protein [Aquimarina sp. MMG016]|nr:T9SS type A sorting domain-containing protein [Aquimarina sp. MMG016]